MSFVQNPSYILEATLRRPNPCDPFPSKLYDLLAIVDELGLSNVVSWLPHGRAFLVRDNDKFMTLVMPSFFKATKMRSFTRQLNLWGFKRIPSGEDMGAWFHESFLRGQPEQLKSIVRIKIKGSAMFQAKRDLDVPDFYRMPPLPIIKSECVSTVSAVKPMHCGLVAPCNLGVLPRQVSVDSAHVEQLKAQYTPNNSCHSVSLESADFESICHIVGSILPGDSTPAPFNPMSAPKQKDESVLSTLITSRFPENEAREEGNYFRDVFSHFPVSDGDDDDVLAPLPMTSNGTMEHVNCDEFSMFIDRMIKDPL